MGPVPIEEGQRTGTRYLAGGAKRYGPVPGRYLLETVCKGDTGANPSEVGMGKTVRASVGDMYGKGAGQEMCQYRPCTFAGVQPGQATYGAP